VCHTDVSLGYTHRMAVHGENRGISTFGMWGAKGGAVVPRFGKGHLGAAELGQLLGLL